MPKGPDADPDDGLPVQVIGEWAEEQKHAILRDYIEATRKVREKYLPPRGKGGAAYTDLFAGPGRARVKSTGAIVDGSPLIAAKHPAAPFSRLILCDSDAGIQARSCATSPSPTARG